MYVYVEIYDHYLGVLGAAVRHLPAREDLPAQDAVGPHVALAREPREIQHLSTGQDYQLPYGTFQAG
jgi:hypothetical protein